MYILHTTGKAYILLQTPGFYPENFFARYTNQILDRVLKLNPTKPKSFFYLNSWNSSKMNNKERSGIK